MKRTTLIFTILAALICGALYIRKGPPTELAVIDEVQDGDTFYTESGKAVRLIGVNTPELDGPKVVEAERAKNWLERFEGKEVKLVYDERYTGPYDRHLCYVYHRGKFINKRLVELDLAEVSFYDNRARAEELKSAR